MSNFRKFISVSAVAILGATNLLTWLTYAQEAKAYDSLTESDLKTAGMRFIMPDKNVYLYAVTEANKYSVVYSGTTKTSWTMNPKEFTYDTTWTLDHNAYVKTWYTFDEWNTNPNGNGTPYADQAEVFNWTTEENGEVPIYAQWNANKYNITYDLNDRSGTSSWVHSKTPTSWVYDQTLTIEKPTRTWYGFSGWDITNMDSEKHIVGWAESYATGATGVEGTSFKNLNATNGETVHFAARWARNTNTAYTVQHFLENIGGWYPATAELTEDKTGTTDTNVTPPVHPYEWFTSPSTQTKNINADGSTNFRYEYTRDSFVLTLKAGRWVASVKGSGTVTSEASTTTSTGISFKYDEPVKLSFTLKPWYATGVWTWYLDGASGFNMPASAQEKTASATPIIYTIKYVYSWWQPQNNPTTYTVESDPIILNQPTRIHSTFEWWVGSNWDTAQKNVTIASGSIWDRGYRATWSCHQWFHDNLDYTKCIPDSDTNYTVRHWQESLTWVLVEVVSDRQILTWTTLSGTNAQPKNYPWFEARLPIAQGTITWDGSTTVDVEYTRLSYNWTITDTTGITNPSADGQYSENKPSYKYDDKVTLTADIQDWYTFKYWTVTDANNNPVTVNNSGNIDGATFNMPAAAVTITPVVSTNVYTLTIISHGGNNGSTGRTYTVEDTVTLINPTRDHSDFAWWSWTDLSQPTMNVSFSSRAKNSTYEETWRCHTWYHASGANECVANQYSGSVNYNDGTSHGAAETISFTYDQVTTLDNPEQSWYDFVWWTITWMSGWVQHKIGDLYVTGDRVDSTDATEFMNLSTEQWFTDITFTAIWRARNDTPYVVYHYVKNVGEDKYTLSWTVDYTWTTDTDVIFNNVKKTFTGFTYSGWYLNGNETRPAGTGLTKANINKDGSTKIYLYYDRNKRNVYLSGDAHVNTLSGAGQYEYGATVNVSATAKTWYHFKRWKRTTDNTYATEF